MSISEEWHTTTFIIFSYLKIIEKNIQDETEHLSLLADMNELRVCEEEKGKWNDSSGGETGK